MKSYWKIGVAVLASTCALGLNPQVSLAQQSANATNAAGNPVANTSPIQTPQAGFPVHATAGEPAFYILAEFSQSLNAKKLKAGDKINAQVTQDVLSHGRIIIPSESRLIGHVTEVECHGAQESESRLGLVFDKVLLKHKREVDFRGVLHALSAPADRRSLVDQPDQMLSPSALGMMRGSSGPSPMGSNSAPGQMSANGAGAIPQGASAVTNPGGVPSQLSYTPPTLQVPVRNATDVAGGIQDSKGTLPTASAQGQPMSVGMPLGVFGLKGLALLPGMTDKTPGPVILSRSQNIKLESGTQVLLRITGVTVPRP